jgi:hypothetical protein
LFTSRDISWRRRAGHDRRLVIRRQRPRGKVVFITLEDEFGRAVHGLPKSMKNTSASLKRLSCW